MATLSAVDISSLLLVEGTAPSAPASGKQRLFVRSSDHLLCIENSSGTVTPYGGALTNPMTNQDDIIIGGAAGAPTQLVKGNAGAALAMGNGHVIWNAGTSFPGSKATNDRYFRTDLGLEYYWDGTRWLSLTLFEWVTSTPETGVSVSVAPVSPYFAPLGGTDLWLVDFRWVYSIATTHSSTQYWTAELHRFKTGTDTLETTLTSDKATVTTYVNPAPTAVGVLLGTDRTLIYLRLTKVSTPGSMTGSMALRYRIVGT